MALVHSPSAHTHRDADKPVLASDETWPDTALAKTIYAHFTDFEGLNPEEAADSTGALLYSLQKVGIVGAPPEPVAWMDRDQDWDVISAIKKADYESVSQHYVWSMERYCRPLYLREEIGVVGSMPEPGNGVRVADTATLPHGDLTDDEVKEWFPDDRESDGDDWFHDADMGAR